MVFSFSRGFIFFGLPKSGSTSLHYLLSRYGELVFSRIENGKHETCQRLRSNCDAFFTQHPYEEFLKFGVIREPTSLVRSWYRVWSNPALANPHHPAHNRWLDGKSIDEFIDILETQHLFDGAESFYRMDDGSLGVDYLIRLDRIKQDTEALEGVLPINISHELARTRFNPSYKGPTKGPGSNPDKVIDERIRKVFAKDMDIYESVSSLNSKFLNSGWQAPDLKKAEKLFGRLYPQPYALGKQDKLYNTLKRWVPDPCMRLIQKLKQILSN